MRWEIAVELLIDYGWLCPDVFCCVAIFALTWRWNQAQAFLWLLSPPSVCGSALSLISLPDTVTRNAGVVPNTPAHLLSGPGTLCAPFHLSAWCTLFFSLIPASAPPSLSCWLQIVFPQVINLYSLLKYKYKYLVAAWPSIMSQLLVRIWQYGMHT